MMPWPLRPRPALYDMNNWIWPMRCTTRFAKLRAPSAVLSTYSELCLFTHTPVGTKLRIRSRARAPSHRSFAIAGVTILLSLTVFSQVVAETMPATSDAVPLLGKWKKRRRRKKMSGVHFLRTPAPSHRRTDQLTRNVCRVLTGEADSQWESHSGRLLLIQQA